LNELGGTSSDALEAASWEDLEDCGLPRIMARRMTHIFRAKSDGSKGKSAYVSDKKAQSMTFEELVERYNPMDVKNSIGKRLKDISDGKTFIVFDDMSQVIVDKTTEMLKDIVSGLPALDRTFVKGVPHVVFKVGDRPSLYMDENPLYPARPLRSGEVCDQTGRSWDGVAQELRQFLALAVMKKEMKISSLSDVHDIMDKALSQKELAIWRNRYPSTSLVFDELKKINGLPILKIKMDDSNYPKSGVVGSGTNDPFGRGSNRSF
jgi:hypothetical protein